MASKQCRVAGVPLYRSVETISSVHDHYRPRNYCVFNLIGTLVLLAFVLSDGCVYTSEIQTKPDKEDDATAGTGDNDKTSASYNSGAMVGSETETAGAACPSDNLTRHCVCRINGDRVAGRQICDEFAGWSVCECVVVPTVGSNNYKGEATEPETNNEVAVFRWKTTPPLPNGNCKAGHYVGVISGMYNSTTMAAYDASFSSMSIPVIGSVEFDLHQIHNSEYFEITNGVMEGLALLLFPVRGDLVGVVNCEEDSSLMEIALKNGIYSVGDTNYFFDGEAVSLYNKKNASFSSGEWAVTEPLDYTVIIRNEDGTADLGNADFAPLPQLVPGMGAIIDAIVEGGTGEWDAFWVGPATHVDISNTESKINTDRSQANSYITY